MAFAIKVPVIPENVSAFINDAGYLTSYTETDPVFTASAAHGITSANITAWNGKQDALTAGSGIGISSNTISADSTIARVSQIPTVPTTVSSFTNDAGYITSTTKNVTLSASSWSSDTYTISDSDITASNVVTLTYPVSTSATDYTALQDADIRATAQAVGSLTLQALGTVPTSDLTITLVIQG